MESEYGCKVCRVLGERDIEEYDDRMLSQWQGDGSQRKGYRQLAEWLNVTLLRREMDKAGLTTLGEEANSKYQRLQSDESSAGDVANMLEREGIDVDRLRDDFVSYGVVRTHITECLGAEYDQPAESNWEREAIDIARDRAEEKVREAVGSLVNKDRIETSTDLEVHVGVEVECENCQSRVPVGRAIRRGHVCHCDSAATTEVE